MFIRICYLSSSGMLSVPAADWATPIPLSLTAICRRQNNSMASFVIVTELRLPLQHSYRSTPTPATQSGIQVPCILEHQGQASHTVAFVVQLAHWLVWLLVHYLPSKLPRKLLWKLYLYRYLLQLPWSPQISDCDLRCIHWPSKPFSLFHNVHDITSSSILSSIFCIPSLISTQPHCHYRKNTY